MTNRAVNTLLYFDLETTSADPWTCRIVEMAFLPIGNWHERAPLVTRVSPGVPIPPEASEIHGIRDGDVADLPGFEAHAGRVQELVDEAVLVGYNSRTFDSIIIDRELRMAGQPGLKRDPERPERITHPEIDLLQLWHQLEPRTLQGALARFLSGELPNYQAHSAAEGGVPAVADGRDGRQVARVAGRHRGAVPDVRARG